MAIYSLAKLTTKNYKNLRVEEGIQLRDLNILIGPNGSGKSNFINVLRFLKQATTSPADESRGITGFEDAVFKLGGLKILDGTIDMPAKVHFLYNFTSALDDESLLLNLFLQVQGKHVSISNEFLSVLGEGQDRGNWYVTETGKGVVILTKYDDEKITLSPPKNDLFLVTMPRLLENEDISSEKKPVYRVRRQLLDTLSQWRFYNANDMSLDEIRHAQPKIGPSDRYLSSSGDNLSLVLYNLVQQSLDFEDQINAAMQAVLPTTRRIRPIASGRISLTTEWHFENVKTPFYLDEMSDGTVRMLCWAIILNSPILPSLLVIEEPEIGIHVAWLRVLAEWIKMASQKTQIIISTHSPDLLDYFTDQVGNVLVFQSCERDSAHFDIKPLSLADVESWLEEGWQLGDLYRVGDPSIGGWPW